MRNDEYLKRRCIRLLQKVGSLKITCLERSAREWQEESYEMRCLGYANIWN